METYTLTKDGVPVYHGTLEECRARLEKQDTDGADWIVTRDEEPVELDEGCRAIFL